MTDAGLSIEDYDRLMLSVGKTPKDQRPLSPVEVGEHCDRAVCAGESKDDIAKRIKLRDVGMIGKFVRLTRLHPDVKHIVSWGRSAGDTLGFSVADQVSRFPQNDQPMLVELILKHRISRDEMISIVQLCQRSGDGIVRCAERVVGRRPRSVVRVVLMGAIKDSDVREKLAAMTQLDRDKCLARSLESGMGNVFAGSARLGVDRFTLVGGKELATAFGSEGFECVVTTEVRRCLLGDGA